MSLIDKFIEIARSFEGYVEKASNSRLDDLTANAGKGNYTLFGQWYRMNGFPWCAMFVSYCAEKAGIPATIIPKHASCAMGVSWFRHAGRWREEEEYDAQAGDIIYFTHDGETPAHVGIVWKTDAATVYTIEGNTSAATGLDGNGGCVALKSYPQNYYRIFGYGNPNYQEETDMTIEEVRKEITTVSGTGADHSAWSEEAVQLLSGADIFRGDGQGNYGWGQCVTREGAAQILYNLLEKLDLLDKLRQEAVL